MDADVHPLAGPERPALPGVKANRDSLLVLDHVDDAPHHFLIDLLVR